MGNVGLAELLHLAGDVVSLVVAGTYALLLDEGVDATLEETTLTVGLHLDDGGVAGDACEVHAVGRAEVAKTIDNETTVIDLDGTHYVGTVTINDVGTVVDTVVSQFAQRATVLAKESLSAVGQMVLGAPLGTAVERDDDDVRLLLEVVQNATDGVEVGVLQCVGIVAEGAEADAESLTLDDGGLGASLNAGKLDAFLAEHALSTEDALLAEVVGVVVGHTQKVEAGLLEPLYVSGRRAEGIDVGTLALGALSTVAEGAFEIAHGKVGLLEDGASILEQLGAIVGRQLDGGEGGTHHNVAAHGDSKGIVAVGG